MTYFVQSESSALIKIGTTGSMTARLGTLRSEYGDKTLHVLAVVDGGRAVELALHKQFSHHRVSGEWFTPGDDLLRFIEKEARPWVPQPPHLVEQQAAKIAGDVLRMARIIVAARGGTVSKLLSDICRPELNRIMREMRTRGELDPVED